MAFSTQRIRGISSEVLWLGLEVKLNRFGVRPDASLVYPEYPSRRLVLLEKALEHLCFGDGEEFFPLGVPVFEGLRINQSNGNAWRAWSHNHMPYWSGGILLLHEWAEPASDWRLLNVLEAASLLGMNPGLRAVRYGSPNATGGVAEMDVREDGQIVVSCGATPLGHHAAYTQQPAYASVHETKL